MNPQFFGDSYDVVKRFFCHELNTMGYHVVVDAMFTVEWNSKMKMYNKLIGAPPSNEAAPVWDHMALFIDPDIGVSQNRDLRHLSIHRLVRETFSYQLVFAFDQSFSRGRPAKEIIDEKIQTVRNLGCHAMYYDSHARFVFVSRFEKHLLNLRDHLIDVGLPDSRLIQLTDDSFHSPERSYETL